MLTIADAWVHVSYHVHRFWGGVRGGELLCEISAVWGKESGGEKSVQRVPDMNMEVIDALFFLR